MIKINLNIDKNYLNKIKVLLNSLGYNSQVAEIRAINKALAKARTEFVKNIRDNYNIKAKFIRDRIKIIKANKIKINGILYISGSPIELIKFVKKPKKIISQKNKKISQRQKIIANIKLNNFVEFRHIFLAKMQNNYIGVFERLNKSSRPIKQKYSISVPQMAGNKIIIEKINLIAQNVLDKELDRQINLLLKNK